MWTAKGLSHTYTGTHSPQTPLPSRLPHNTEQSSMCSTVGLPLLFIFGCAGSSLLHRLFSGCGEGGLLSSCSSRASYCSGLSGREARMGSLAVKHAWALWLWSTHGLSAAWASVVVAHGLSSCSFWVLEHRLNSCGTWAWWLHSLWDLPWPGLKPVSLALAGGFLTLSHQGSPEPFVL